MRYTPALIEYANGRERCCFVVRIDGRLFSYPIKDRDHEIHPESLSPIPDGAEVYELRRSGRKIKI